MGVLCSYITSLTATLGISISCRPFVGCWAVSDAMPLHPEAQRQSVSGWNAPLIRDLPQDLMLHLPALLTTEHRQIC